MSFFHPTAPLLCRKPEVFKAPDSPGLWRIHYQLGEVTLVSTFYTRLDQTCILWSLISFAIFGTAQFFPISWTTQAIWWSVLTLMGTVGTIALTPSWLKTEKLKWVLDIWVILMLFGLIITDFSIFWGWGIGLMSLCPLWLGLSGLGYLGTGLGMRSRTLVLMGLFHLVAIAILPLVGAWQFLVTGFILGFSVLLLAIFQWDSIGACGDS